MLKSQHLLELADQCEKALDNDSDIFKTAYEAIFGPKPSNRSEKTTHSIVATSKYNRFHTLCQIGAFTDAAMLLRGDIPWLVPIMDYAERTVRLVNGIGLPVGGDDHLSRAGTMPLALAASWLKAQARKAFYEEFEEKETENV